MARYDKYDPISGGFRAPLAANLTPDADGEVGPVAVSVDANGRAVVGTGGTSGLVGVMVKNAPKLPAGPRSTNPFNSGYFAGAPIGLMAGDVVDIMTSGEIVFDDAADAPAAAGSAVYSDAAGDLSGSDGAGANTRVGWMVEATRLIVRVAA